MISRHPSTRHKTGFSLLELLVVLCIGAMLTLLATSGYAAVLRRATRHEVRLALWRLAAAQENHRLQFGQYAIRIAVPPMGTASVETMVAPPLPSGWSFAFQSVSDTGWMVVAIATDGTKAPARDSDCLEWRLDQTGAASARASDGRDTSATCWRR